ncbi:MAG TPA: hypothetical protein GX010_01500 [Erysipelotrichaceae bacterium]|nr:hypothetical protein [Erysipelotrichaceae bacterium]
MDFKKLNTKENAKRIRIISMILSLIAIVVIGLSSIAPIIRAYIPGSMDPEFDWGVYPGQEFLGWQVTFVHWGTNIPIADRRAFTTNPLMVMAMVGTCLVLLITMLMMRRGKRLKKGILELVAAAFLIFTAIVYFSACPIILTTAGNLTLDALTAANNLGNYHLCWYAIFVGVVSLVIAIAKLVSAAFFIGFRKTDDIKK